MASVLRAIDVTRHFRVRFLLESLHAVYISQWIKNAHMQITAAGNRRLLPALYVWMVICPSLVDAILKGLRGTRAPMFRRQVHESAVFVTCTGNDPESDALSSICAIGSAVPPAQLASPHYRKSPAEPDLDAGMRRYGHYGIENGPRKASKKC